MTHLSAKADHHEDIIYPPRVLFALVHVTCFAAIWTGVTVEALAICIILYFTRMFAVTAGYHRYFSHRSFKTSRIGQFLLAFAAQTSAQRGILWWAGKHRHHHKYSDLELDIHSPLHRGFWYAHVGWIFARNQGVTDLDAVPDLAQYPELRWLDRHRYLPAIMLAVATWLVAGWPGLIVGFFWSTVILYHGSFAINSLAHVHGARRYVTGDDSRNNWWLALITMGEGWHNNHHAYMASARQGFRWWEVDFTYYGLTVLSWLGVVWDINRPPKELIRNERKLARGIVDKVAERLVATISIDRIGMQIRHAWTNTSTLEKLQEKAREARSEAHAMLMDMHLPHVPTVEELRERARDMFAATPSLDDIVARAREIMFEALATELLIPATPPRA